MSPGDDLSSDAAPGVLSQHKKSANCWLLDSNQGHVRTGQEFFEFALKKFLG